MRTETTFFSDPTYLFKSSMSITLDISSAHKQIMTPIRTIPTFLMSSVWSPTCVVPEIIPSF
ncbi:MAG: hypothetical protein ACW99Q_26085, partial [Candidatus Kariarchaeaceae archaeon]